jgi:glycosyltransferase involved in cell wall biosynthesis
MERDSLTKAQLAKHKSDERRDPPYRVMVVPDPLRPPRTGIGHYALELLRAFASQADFSERVRLIGFRSFFRPFKPRTRLVSLFEETNWAVEMHSRPLPAKLYKIFKRRRLQVPVPIDLFKSGNDIYFFPNFVGQPLIKSPSVVVIYDLSFKLLPETLSGRNYADYLSRYVPKYLRRASRVLAISTSTKDDLVRHYSLDDEKIEVIYPGVDHTAFTPDISESRRAEVRGRYRLPEQYILTMSTLSPRKNLTRLIEAYAALDSEWQLPLVLAGNAGWKYEPIFKKINDLGLQEKVHVIGYVDDNERGPLFSGAKLFVLPSLHEGFGMPALEAMASGSPVVTSRAGALTEVCGTAAVYVEPTSTDSIARAIQTVLANDGLREKMVAEGLIQSRKFTWDASARKLARVFDQIMEERLGR